MSSFDVLVQEFLAAELAADPVTATALGAPGHDAALPDLSAAGVAERSRVEAGFAERFHTIQGLTEVEQIDRDLALMSLRRRAVLRDDWAGWRRYPDTYTSPVLNGVFLLFLHRLAPEPELTAAAVARLDGTGELLAAGRANLDPQLVAPVLARRALAEARGALGWLRTGVAQLAEGERERAQLAAAGERAAEQFEDYIRFLDELAGRCGGSFALGAERYTTLLREAEGLAYGVEELHRRGRAAHAELLADLRARAREISGSEDWRAVLESMNDDHPATPELMRREYEEWTARARRFVYERELVSEPPGEGCDVTPSPPFRRAVLAVASYMPPPAFTGSRRGTFFVPTPPDGATAEQVAQRLATNSHAAIPVIAVHEAYPGHHWHLAWVAATCDRPLRKLLHSSYFVEGWAHYTEQLLREAGFFTDPRQELAQVDMRLFRAARIVVDTALHTGQMDVEEAVEFMSTNASLSHQTAQTEVARYCAWPTQAASYLTGAIEIERMREEWVGAGRCSLREFHDRLAGTGELPIGLAERALAAG